MGKNINVKTPEVLESASDNKNLYYILGGVLVLAACWYYYEKYGKSGNNRQNQSA